MPVNPRVVRSDEEIQEVQDHARALTDKAEADGGSDESADGVYQFIQWLFGDTDISPQASFLEPED